MTVAPVNPAAQVADKTAPAKRGSAQEGGQNIFAQLLAQASEGKARSGALVEDSAALLTHKGKKAADKADDKELSEPLLNTEVDTNAALAQAQHPLENRADVMLGDVALAQTAATNAQSPGARLAIDASSKGKASKISPDSVNTDKPILAEPDGNEPLPTKTSRGAFRVMDSSDKAIADTAHQESRNHDTQKTVASAAAATAQAPSFIERSVVGALHIKPAGAALAPAAANGKLNNARLTQAQNTPDIIRGEGKNTHTDPDLFMRHLDQSLQVAQQMGSEPGQRISAGNTSSGGFAESTVRSDISTTQAPPTLPGAAGPMTTAGGVPVYAVSTHIQHEGWAKAMSHQVVSFMRRAEQGEQIAQLRLDPPELGPIRVSITLADGVAHAAFGSANAHVRQAIEQALPDLARAMSDAGINLGQTDVGGEDGNASVFAQSNQDGSRGSSGEPRSAQSGAGGIDTQSDTARAVPTHDGLVNTFA